MRKDILSHLRKPPPYAKSDGGFWDDAHISEQLLRAHLDTENEGASRPLPFIERSAAWIREIVPPEQFPLLLDIGCGPGLYAQRFARDGYRVTGMDFSRRSIAYARQSALRQGLQIRYLRQNYLEMTMGAEFDFATMIYCDYGALSAKERIVLLQRVFRCLKPGGKFLFDVFSEAAYASFREEQTWESCPEGGFWREDAYVALSGHYRYPDRITLEQTTVITEEEIVTYRMWNTCFSREALAEEVQAGGFRVSEVFSDVAGKEFSRESQTMAFLLEKPQKETLRNR